MKLFPFFWKTHRWTGLSLAAVFLLTAGTGLLLLWKKEFGYLQPPTQRGAPADLEAFLPIAAAWEIVKRQDHPDFRTQDDISRIDVRPGKRVYKVRSRHNDSEIQIDASTGAVLSTGVRRSDFVERLHDGSWIGNGFKVLFMPLAALGLLYLVFTGVWIWLHPKLRKARIRKRQAAARQEKSGRVVR